MARWRTRAVFAVLVLGAASLAIVAVVLGSGSSRETKAVRTQLFPIGQDPLRVKGTGFRRRERVRLTVEGTHVRRTVTAGTKGAFVAVLAGVDPCDSVTVDATGSRGSHAAFNLSAGIVCR